MYPLVYIARHGQTVWNAESRLQGQADTDLNPLGREQATRNGHRLAEFVITPKISILSPARCGERVRPWNAFAWRWGSIPRLTAPIPALSK